MKARKGKWSKKDMIRKRITTGDMIGFWDNINLDLLERPSVIRSINIVSNDF